MEKNGAIRELRANINCNFSHAVLLYNGRAWHTELHGGHAGNCCCNDHADFVWRETAPYTDPDDMTREISEAIGRKSASFAAAAMGRVKSDRKAASSRENGRKGGRPRKAVKP